MSSVGGIYAGDPETPFPWLTWNNRPFVNSLELLQVPVTKSRDLLLKYDVATTSNPYSTPDPLFPHLLNFFFSEQAAGASSQMHRLLDYVGVPSPFTCAEIQVNPNYATGAGHAFHPPFNQISTYREPGRINLNTIYGVRTSMPAVWRGLMSGFPSMNKSSFWQKFLDSRDGPTGTTCPSSIAHPFRSSGGALMVPPVASLEPADNREINATLLREDPDPTNAGHPLFEFTSGQEYNNTDRNPYFRYQGLERLGNLVTTRSNVFAVWITVGYFEVTPAPAGYSTAVYPDGYQLGRELGSDTGEIDRHRAFYIFDRTLPVGFQRGQDLNVDKAILVKRFIE